MSMAVLDEMQSALARLIDTQVEHRVSGFAVTERQHWQTVSGLELQDEIDEQVAIAEEGESAAVGVYVDASVLQRLVEHDPFALLDEHNLADFCTALEGVSHFHYLMWCIEQHRQVSLLELELQAEVDKYSMATTLWLQQHGGHFPAHLHHRLFGRVCYVAGLDALSRQRYEQANRHAARFCRHIDDSYLRCRRQRPEAWMRELRGFYRCGQHEKMRRARC